MNWTHHIPISRESTRIGKKYTYLISATTQKPSPKIIHCQTCSQDTSLICTHMPTWTWVISTRRRHRLSKLSAQNLKPQLRTWNPSSKLETPAQKCRTWWWSIFEYSMPKTTQSQNLTLTRKRDQKNQNTSSITTIFVILGLVKKRVDFRCLIRVMF